MEMIIDNCKKAITYDDDFKPVKWYVDGNLLTNVSFYDKISTGNPLNFKSEYNKSLINLALKGTTEQKSYEGYNRFDINNIVQTANSANNFTRKIRVENGVIYFGSQYRVLGSCGIVIPATPGKRFFLTWEIDVASDYYPELFHFESIGEDGLMVNWERFSINAPNTTKLALTQHMGKNYVCLVLNNVDGHYKAGIKNIQFVEDTEQPYEPYTGGKPSPNAEYPQPIHSSSNIELMLSSSELTTVTISNEIELNKLGDIADELIVDYSAKTVTLIKRIEKFELKDQIESVRIDETWEPGNVAIVTTQSAWEHNKNNLCSHCKYFTGDTSILSFDCQNNEILFYIVNQSTPEDFIQWATDNNVQMALVRYSPEVTEFKYKDEDETSAPVWVQNLLNLSPKRNQTNVITITSDLPISEQIIKYAKWGGADED